MKSMTVEVNPEVIKWLRESSGWRIEEVSKRLGTSSETVLDFEAGKRSPTLTQLSEMSKSFKRPIASFFLPKPKQDKPLPKDYRFIPNKTGIFDKKTILAIRRSRSLQSISRDLSVNIRYETETKAEKAKLSEDPDSIARKYRELFSLSSEKQKIRRKR